MDYLYEDDDYLSSLTQINYSINYGQICDPTWHFTNSTSGQSDCYRTEDSHYNLEQQSRIASTGRQIELSVTNFFLSSSGESHIIQQSNTHPDDISYEQASQNMDPKEKVRTVAEAVRRRDVTLPEHIPTELWKTSEEAKIELDSWAYNLKVGGGRFSLNWGGQTSSTSKKGFQKVLICTEVERLHH